MGPDELSKTERPGELVRLENALRSGSGHVAVTAGDHEEADRLVEQALKGVPAYAVLHVSASADDPLADCDRALGLRSAPAPLDCDRRDALVDLVRRARTHATPVFAIVRDGDKAGAEALERTRMALECAPNLIDRLRIIVTGTLRLDSVLREPAADALASRIGARIRLAPSTKTEQARAGARKLFDAARQVFSSGRQEFGLGRAQRTAATQPAPVRPAPARPPPERPTVASPAPAFAIRADRALTIGWAESLGADGPVRPAGPSPRRSFWKRLRRR